MLNMKKVELFKKIAIVLVAIFLFVAGFYIGTLVLEKNTTQQVKKEVEKEVEQSNGLTQQYVTDFLSAYYTKSELGENRNVYEPFMTSEFYNSIVEQENEPAQQAYKGYIIDQKYDDRGSTIYINSKDNIAIAQVSYTNTLLQKKNDATQNVVKNNSNKVTIEITYKKQSDGTLLVNNMRATTLGSMQSGGGANTGNIVPDDESSSSSYSSTTEYSSSSASSSK